MDLAGKKIILGLTGGVACYKAAELTRALSKAGATVQIVMTDAATHFITPVTMQALSGNPVVTDQWDARVANNMPHIDLTRDADAIVIAPCSADFIFKLAHGACDDLLSTLCVARPDTLPLMIAPAMNVEMWQNPATKRNVAQVRADRIAVFGPDAGEQACGETGMGRMLEPEQLLEEIIASFQPNLLVGKSVMVTAGPTFEPIDPVRGITNLSSGKMGYAIARAAREAGAEVTLISGPTALAAPYGVHCINVQTAAQMHDAVMSRISSQHVFIAVAAVADWRVKNQSAQKLKKDAAGHAPALEFEQNTDILAAVAALEKRPYCVGFAAESENLQEYGEAKRKKKNIPLLVGNIGHQTFGQDQNELMLFDDQGHTLFPLADKQKLARQLVGEIARRL
ncbi:Coenzyme A biosynthesis bifunctional protein coaBC (DNA/pantothenate metabolism flavoprotein) [Includes: Phosphopantothenoylcysteine decarboxylase (PPCDC) (CoaC); Phosphopantothenate--cysteine ligase (Phosphopantothenoylcysteine synthase) (PPC synthetase) (PPCS) (CoaB)] [Herminiimonas arsenicoxydans]|uniref:Coenzyme A biosynthesis bifunctional protein CoaBC n=1 Tax=Herminiimonas arsenicoxydans TaxID=204773 RepID=A4G3E4_HERAR|nr:Coenzyme A biosynthesis bifunctional protein coaBC (DNA/pantothenate metabolism flavoprotein) [Includes: Phosphopantothenoylcysteine decarboxylase (PPCDC) (CoaC); Phosphopantothenate--cysteine ligase (Phosphopantothenoylcysteine synthase) (PPC synthetase) (PPCS) (CoaB)] [Herminiimonas arsenicoxydans]